MNVYVYIYIYIYGCTTRPASTLIHACIQTYERQINKQTERTNKYIYIYISVWLSLSLLWLLLVVVVDGSGGCGLLLVVVVAGVAVVGRWWVVVGCRLLLVVW